MDQILKEYPLKIYAPNGGVAWQGNALLGNWSKVVNGETAASFFPGAIAAWGAGSGKAASLGMPDAAATAEPVRQWVKVLLGSTTNTNLRGVCLTDTVAGDELVLAMTDSVVPCRVSTLTNNTARAFVVPTAVGGRAEFTNTAPTAPALSVGRVIIPAGTTVATQSGSASYGIIVVGIG